MRFVERDGIRVAYRTRGTGPAILLVQGMSVPGELWLELPSGLAARVRDPRWTAAPSGRSA